MSKLINHLRNKDVQNLFLDVAYGRHIVEGDLCKSLTDDSGNIYVQHKLGKREWNACKKLWWRGFNIAASDYKFHPGTLSTGNEDTVQGVDAIFSMDIPHSLQAWIRAKVPLADAGITLNTSTEEPSGLAGIFECLKVNNYNSAGTVTDFSYSENPARQILDAFLIEGGRSASRIDFGAFCEWRDCLAEQILCDYTALPDFEGFGLTANYYNGASFDTFIEERVDAVVEFDSDNGRPAYGLNEVFSARYEGKIKPRFTETYTFYLYHDDGAKLWVNGSLIIDQWGTAGSHSATIALTADTFYDIKIEWENTGGHSGIKLEWQSTSQPREVAPSDRLYPKPKYVDRWLGNTFFSRPTRLDDGIRTMLRLCNSAFQRINGKYRFFCYDQITSSSFTFDEAVNYYPNSLEIKRRDPTRTRNVWQATCRDLDSQFFDQLIKPIVILRENLIAEAGQRIDGDLFDFYNSTRFQTYRLLTEIVKREAGAPSAISLTGNAESYPVLKGDRVKINLELLNLTNYECRVTRSVDKSSETTADDREFSLKEWI
ncbi:MAG: hypothetical protein K1X72_04240 [Pyrinomonadaceae bacterium]|nr:hypothetical protein [Pyrinomonadaceae bacterium]